MASFLLAKPFSNAKPRLVILGTGWAGYGLALKLNKSLYNVTVISPRNYFLFTPLLTTTTVGTLEFRNITEPVRHIKDVTYIQASCESISHKENSIRCFNELMPKLKIDLNYDILVVACGATSNSFGIKGVEENCYFMKQISHSKAIRKRINELFELTQVPGLDNMTKRELLTFVIVGAGPASIEFAAELHDFLVRDAFKYYPEVSKYLQIYLIEAAKNILGMFNTQLREYTHNMFKERKIAILCETSVKEVNKDSITLSNGEILKTGMIVWNTGNKQIPFIEQLKMKKGVFDENGNSIENVFSLGDCSTNSGKPLPPTAQAAQQQAIWLSNMLNKGGEKIELTPFKYTHRGTLAYIGNYQALVDTDLVKIKGIPGWVFWNSVYLAKQFSIKNKISIPFLWSMSYMFGRNISNL